MRNVNNCNDKKKKKKSLKDHECCAGSSKQAPDFEVTNKFMIDHTEENFDIGTDVTEALRALTNLGTNTWRSTTQASEADDEVSRDRESRELEINCKGKSADRRKRARESEKDPRKACVSLWVRCQLASRERIYSQMGLKESIRSNPIELLMVNKKDSLDYEDPRAWTPVVPDACRALFNCECRDDELLSDYNRIFKAARETLHSNLGGLILVPKAAAEIHPT